MRQRHLKAPASFPVAHDHCRSRVVIRDLVFGPHERERFVRLFRQYERFRAPGDAAGERAAQ